MTVKYIVNLESALSHGANDSRRKWLSAPIPQLHKSLLFIKTYGWLEILTGVSLLMLHIMCLSFGQLAKIISFPPSSTVGDIFVLL